ncbi:hypothetical protein CH330_03715 [candidate division WOR-3 bacterium JGI_Cruoil_03_51_56]|uniref:Uncharacterized protein n=1 Tax=candidate division WOR-3 bacterium JGI_Cruoil_03_51_56 TaxID=1973747 RepID=A0A235BV59_UNCW3|nr:MAG: hypothetical protein CH330_03715 [candidate division WOR-3 bacterium JGI_Cruoil_03_51_56]
MQEIPTAILSRKLSADEDDWSKVDSTDVDFKVATSIAFRDAFMAAAPTFLEPIMDLVSPLSSIWAVFLPTSRQGTVR